MTSSLVGREALPLSTLKTARTPRRQRNALTAWSLTDAGSELISPLLNEPIPPPLESTWAVPRTAEAAAEAEAEVVVAAAAAVAVAAVVVHQGVSQGTMTGATTEAMTEVMIVTMIVMMTESTDHTDADLHLLITAGATALDPGPGPTHHVTIESSIRRVNNTFIDNV